MSANSPDPEVMAEQSGYYRGCLETKTELSFRIKAILMNFLHNDKYTASTMAESIGRILDGK